MWRNNVYNLWCFVAFYNILLHNHFFCDLRRFVAKSVLVWFTGFCVEKNWAKNCARGEKMTNMRYGPSRRRPTCNDEDCHDKCQARRWDHVATWIRKAVSLKELISALKKRGWFFPSYCGNCLELSSPSQLSKYDRRVQNELEELEEILSM